MSKETDRLDTMGIHNNHNLASRGDGIFINFHATAYRNVTPNHWAVCKVGKNLGEASYDNGARTFSGLKRDTTLLIEVLTFASTLNNETLWVKSPFDGYISKATADKVGVKYTKKHIIDLDSWD